MHKLKRDPNAPVCLSRYRHGINNWGMQSPTPEERVEIWGKLNAMQGDRCAYCEATICEGRRHIEHFRQRSNHSPGTFNWSNLFGSCNRQDTCGKHKDTCGPYHHSDLIKPDIDDPDDFFVFTPDGSVSPKANLSEANHHRATESIRIFNLNGVLRQIRFAEIVGYVQTAEELAEMAVHYPPSDWLPLLEEELAATESLPFATAIHHVLTRRS